MFLGCGSSPGAQENSADKGYRKKRGCGKKEDRNSVEMERGRGIDDHEHCCTCVDGVIHREREKDGRRKRQHDKHKWRETNQVIAIKCPVLVF